MGMAASIGLCMGTTFALCTAIPVAGEVHSPQARKRAHNRAGHEFEDVAMKHRSHGGHGGHGKHHDDHDGPGGGPGGENNDALRYQISEIHERGPKLPGDGNLGQVDRNAILERAHQRQLMMDKTNAEHPPDRVKHSQGSAGHNVDKRNEGSGGMPSQRPTSAEDKEFLRSFFAAQDAKGGKSAWQDQLSRGPKDFFFRDDTDHYIPNVHEIHREIINKQAKKLDSGTKKSVNATLDKHAHHNFMRQDSMKGKRGNAAAARLQQDHISDSHQALGKKTYARPVSPKAFAKEGKDKAGNYDYADPEKGRHRHHNAHHHEHPHHHDEWHRTSSHH